MPTGLEFLEPTLNALELERIDYLQITYAITVAQQHHPPLETGRPALVTHLQGLDLAERVKRTLLNAYADNHTISLVRASDRFGDYGVDSNESVMRALYKLQAIPEG